MTPFTLALAKIHNEARRIAALSHFRGEEIINLENIVGRISFGEVLSPEALPAYATSAMDGFAVRSLETLMASTENPIFLPILGSIAAGDFHSAIGDPQSAKDFGVWEIMTGASFPVEFDACIRIEDVELSVDKRLIKINRPAKPAQNRRQSGEDFQTGSPLLRRGQVLRSEDILPLAALGIKEVAVFRRLRVAIISTGKELVAYSDGPLAGQIRNSTTPYLMVALRNHGCEVEHIATVADDPENFKKVLGEIGNRYDLVLTTGAISVGRYDFVGTSLQELGAEIFFKKVAIRPGKPLLFARLRQGPYLIGLPGNPLATAVGFRFFVVPFLRSVLGQTDELPYRARLAATTISPAGVITFLKGKLQRTEDHSLEVVLNDEQRASLLHPLLSSDVWVALPPTATGEFAASSEVDVYPF